MVFGSSGYFTGLAMELTQGRSWPTLEKWHANDAYSVLYFEEGKFLYVSIAMGATSGSADCEKF